MNSDQLHEKLADQLRDKPLGTVANITDFAVAYWDGQQVLYAFLRDEGCGRIEGEFDLTEHEFEQWADALEMWADKPTFSVHPEVLEWLKDSPSNN
jgi:hypothetical protein